MSKPDSGTIKRRNKHGPIGCAQERMPEDSVLANRLRLIVHRGSSPAAAQFKADLIGLDLDQSGNIYVAYTGHSKHDFRKDLANPFHPACRDATVTQSGVYKIDAKTRKVTPLATKVEGWAFLLSG